jgi:hypothetical protein
MHKLPSLEGLSSIETNDWTRVGEAHYRKSSDSSDGSNPAKQLSCPPPVLGRKRVPQWRESSSRSWCPY